MHVYGAGIIRPEAILQKMYTVQCVAHGAPWWLAQMPKKLCLVGGDMGRGPVESKHEIISLLRNFMIRYSTENPCAGGPCRKSGRATTRDAVGR